jgi:VWFA-related protein
MHLVRLALLTFVSAAWVSAQQPVYTLRVDVPLVSVEVTVQDAAGRSITHLNKEDFQIYEDAKLQEIRNFSPVATPYNVLLLFDRSGSTQNQWLFMQRAVTRFLEGLRPQDGVSIAAFDDEFETLLDWTNNHTLALASLDGLTRPKAAGGTDFYRSLERAVDRHFREVKGRKAVIVFSDGRDTRLYRQTVTSNRVPAAAEDREFQKALRAVHSTGTPVYFVAMNTDRNLENEPGNDYAILQRIYPRSSIPHEFLLQVRQRMEQLADLSGGRIFFPNTLEDVIPLYQRISEELGTSYSLGYLPFNESHDGKYRHIEVRVANAEKVWQSRQGYEGRKD